jgi:hypothetical protein
MLCCVCTGLGKSIQVIVVIEETGSHRAPNDDRSGGFLDSRFQEFLNHMPVTIVYFPSPIPPQASQACRRYKVMFEANIDLCQ